MNKQETLSVTLIQTNLHWEDAQANRDMFSKKIENISQATDLIVLPEMFSTGFSMSAKLLAEPNHGETLQWMQQQAKKTGAAITGSVIILENGNYYNRLFFVLSNGDYKTYDKKHTFTLANEHRTYTAGSNRLVVDYKGFRICPLICYDLRFPVWARNTVDYDVLLYVANWPAKRIAAWDALLKARAIENMAYCVGVNRVGEDGNGHVYTGHTGVYDVLGASMLDTEPEKEFVATLTLKKEHIKKHREHLQFLQDRDSFILT
ncbi:amidohydrolase [Altibacter sp.]|uniref:amidohydrolase n=1 Tax=Altibacter sp. TaxID=2024823 RepID=UPI000C8C808D|nr:amidohydrolase [Altibacter sp.]MAP54024.1 amidohydrolase [Altibacter sp.]